MERHHLGDELFHLINTYLQENGMKVNRGTIVDATIIAAPGSTKNRDPEMGATRKGNQWYFGMKAHIGVDSRSKLIHSAVATAAKLRLKNGRSDKTDEIRRTTITKMDNSCRPGNIQLKIWMRRVKNS